MSNPNITDEGRVLLDLTIVAVRVLTDKGVKQPAAVVVAAEITKEFYRLYGGQNMYIPVRRVERAAKQAAEVVAEFNGKNYRELALKFGLSERWVRIFIKRHKERSK